MKGKSPLSRRSFPLPRGRSPHLGEDSPLAEGNSSQAKGKALRPGGNSPLTGALSQPARGMSEEKRQDTDIIIEGHMTCQGAKRLAELARFVR